MLTILALTIGLFFAMNIGASGAAASMGIAYGAGVIKKSRNALILCGIAVFLGAWLGGGEVVKTIGSGIVPSSTFTTTVALIVLASAAISLFLSNVLGIPLSTSEVTIGAVVGAGIVYQSVFVGKLVWICMFWLITPFIAFGIAIVATTLLKSRFIQSWIKTSKSKRVLTVLVIVLGMFEAFSAGMNNVANAVGPLVGASLISTETGVLWGGIFVAAGAIFLGRRVLETNGKKITTIKLEEGCVISGTGAGIVTVASVFGIPLPLTQITTSSIIGIGFAKHGKKVFQKAIVAQLLAVWIVSPVLSMVLSYTIIQLVVEQNVYPIIIIIGSLICVFGIKFLMRPVEAVRLLTERNN